MTRRYSAEPDDPVAFTSRWQQFYSRWARPYDLAVRWLPLWRTWLGQALPEIAGPRVLEVSVGTGWLLTRYAGRHDTHGVDLSEAMVRTARHHLARAGLTADLQVADVEHLPYADGTFDTVLTTMAFSGYPDGRTAMAELLRVLRPDGRLIVIDINYPGDGNRIGTLLVNAWRRSGDLIRDINSLLGEFGIDVTDREIGGFGSVHLYLASRRAATPPPTARQ